MGRVNSVTTFVVGVDIAILNDSVCLERLSIKAHTAVNKRERTTTMMLMMTGMVVLLAIARIHRKKTNDGNLEK